MIPKFTAFKVPVIESERGWGRKIDDYMVCLTLPDALEFTREFNSKNVQDTAPDWYMQAEGDPEPITLSESQMNALNVHHRIWLSELSNI